MRYAQLLRLVACLAVLLPTLAGAADTYQYDELGNLQSLTTDSGTHTYSYDEVNRLDQESGPAGSRDHAYDANGNRSTDGAGTTATYAPNSDRLATLNGTTVSLDAAGHLLSDGTRTYTWDAAGRLKTVSAGSTLLATYHYDYKSRRSRKETTAAAPQGAHTVVYHYDQGDNLLAETLGDGTPIKTYIWDDGRLVALLDHATTPPTLLFLATDHLGSPRAARTDTGTVVWRWDSDGYGTTLPNEDPDGNGTKTTINLRFPGQYYDQEAGLHYNWNRYYSPRLGRYVSSDPIGVAGGINAYGYVSGNPIIATDPTGQLALVDDAVFWTGVGVGAILMSSPAQKAIAGAVRAIKELCSPDDPCGPDGRAEAIAKALAFAGIPPGGGDCDPMPWSDYNNKGRNYAEMRQQGVPCMGYRGPGGKPKIEDHPDGHDDENQPHHKCPHIHATNAQGQKAIFPYKMR
jgi:RHS repeat-associated protein